MPVVGGVVLRQGSEVIGKTLRRLVGSTDEVAATAGEFYRVNPSQIRFTQDTVSPNFSDGGTLNEAIQYLRAGKELVTKYPTIRVVKYNGNYYSLDNRRLTVFKAAQVNEIPVQLLDLNDPAVRNEFLKKFHQVNGGLNNVVVPAAEMGSARKVLREHGK